MLICGFLFMDFCWKMVVTGVQLDVRLPEVLSNWGQSVVVTHVTYRVVSHDYRPCRATPPHGDLLQFTISSH